MNSRAMSGDVIDNQHSEKSWRIDAQIEPFSQWRVLVGAVWSFIILLIMSLANLLWWQWLLMIIVLASCFFVYQLQKLPVVHLTQPELYKKGHAPWFIYIEYLSKHQNNNQRKLQLWQGNLCSTHVNRYFVLLQFDIIEPLPQSINLCIWRDQVTNESWRKLQVFARVK